MLVVGWSAVSARADFVDQLPWAVVGLVGLLVAFCAQAVFVLRVRRVVAVRLRSRFGHGVKAARHDRPGLVQAGDVDLVAGEGLRRYHRSDCALAREQRWPEKAEAAHRAAGLLPCGVCRP
jgi:hypothetical protein